MISENLQEIDTPALPQGRFCRLYSELVECYSSFSIVSTTDSEFNELFKDLLITKRKFISLFMDLLLDRFDPEIDNLPVLETKGFIFVSKYSKYSFIKLNRSRAESLVKKMDLSGLAINIFDINTFTEKDLAKVSDISKCVLLEDDLTNSWLSKFGSHLLIDIVKLRQRSVLDFLKEIFVILNPDEIYLEICRLKGLYEEKNSTLRETRIMNFILLCSKLERAAFLYGNITQNDRKIPVIINVFSRLYFGSKIEELNESVCNIPSILELFVFLE